MHDNLHLSKCHETLVFRYVQLNVQCCESNRRYNEAVPLFLRNRPREFVRHVCHRWSSAASVPKENVLCMSSLTFTVKSTDTDNTYCVFLAMINQCPAVPAMTGALTTGRVSTCAPSLSTRLMHGTVFVCLIVTAHISSWMRALWHAAAVFQVK